jgi:hypothetical protein
VVVVVLVVVVVVVVVVGSGKLLIPGALPLAQPGSAEMLRDLASSTSLPDAELIFRFMRAF